MNPNITTFYINLDDSTKRDIEMKKIFKKYHFTNVTRLSAVDTRDYKKAMQYQSFIRPDELERLKTDVKLGRRRRFGSLTLGAIGCTLSHMNIYKIMIDQNIKNALIFEDDILVDLEPDEFWKRMKNIDIPEDTDMYTITSGYYEWKKKIKPESNTVTFGRFVGTCAYYITLKGANILYKNLIPILYQVDFQMSMLALANVIKIYGYDGPTIFTHGSYKYGSTIQDINCDDNCDILDLLKESKKVKAIETFNNNSKNYNLQKNIDFDYIFYLILILNILVLYIIVKYN